MRLVDERHGTILHRSISIFAIALLLAGWLAAPANVLAASLKLTWTASTGTVDGYKIERASSSTGTWAQVAKIASSPTSYTDSNVLAAATYYYRVRAYNTVGDSGYSSVAGGGTLPALVVTTPSDYQTFTNTSTTVAGTAYHASGIQSVTVNGQAATLTGTNWNATVTLTTGTNTLAVLATDSSPSANTVTQTVHAVRVATPVASFSASPTSGTMPLTVSFTDSSTGSITNRNWAFGDGATTNLASTSFEHIYTSAGAFTVRLIASGPAGTSTNTQANVVVVTTPAQLAVSPSSNSLGTISTGTTAQVTFTVSNTGGAALSGSASVAAPFTIFSGSSFNLVAGASTNVVVQFAPTAATGYSANVIFTSTAGSSTNAVTGAGALVPVALFSASPTNGTAKLNVTFTDASTGTITNRLWNFGDGTTLTTTNTSVAYTYTAPGTNTVRLIVSGPVGVNTNTQPAYVRVVYFPPGDVDGSGTVTTNDVRLINEVLTGLRATNDAVFQTTSFASGDVNQDGAVNSSDSLLIKQVLAGLREYVVTEVMPSSRNNTVPTTVTISGISFPTAAITAVTFGSPINLTVSNFTVISDERIQLLLPAGGGLGTGTVYVTASPTNGITSFGTFINK